jgi:bifunctional DNA-binding transcriptional regulator/antitoxin component of YhaV-PrlF toxin-antitoxin module
MAVLAVTARGQTTLRREVLRHLGVEPGGKIEVDLLPGGKVQLSAAQPRGPIGQLSGLLAGKTNGARLTVDEIAEATARAGAVAGAGR